MGRLRTLLVTGAALAISGAAAHAADMPSLPWPLPAEKTLQVDELFSGWYLRGDVGYRFQHVKGASDSANDYTTSSFPNAFMGGGGAGFKANWFRADLTGDYGWRSLYSGSTASGANSVSMKIDTFTVMLNGYLDLGTWAGFTPYLGAGIGGAYLSSSSYQNPSMVGAMSANAARWNVAWAAMAGVSYNLAYNLLVDVGYRHVEMGDAIGGPAPNQLTVKRLTGDEIRIGIRYLID